MIKRFLWMMSAVAAGATIYAAPSVTSVSFSQEETGPRTVTVDYTLAGEEAIVTMDVLVNGESIGDENIQYLEGDVNRLVQPGSRQIKWFAQKSWPGHKIDESSVTVRVNAWTKSSPPDYMVVDLEAPNNVRYYASTNALPDGGLTNRVYASSRLVMKFVEAAGVTYTMGKPGASGAEAEHSATLAKNYYIGIYTITQGQWKRIIGWYPQSQYAPSDAATRDFYPVQYAAYNEIRQVEPLNDNTLLQPSNADSKGAKDVVGDDTYAYPAAPAPVSWLGQLSSHAGIAFDLPGESEWEYACRAGNYGNYWGDGTPISGSNTDANLTKLGHYLANSGSSLQQVGLLKPNSWGIYDMHGNMWEWCLDCFNANISSLNGAVDTRKNGEARTERGGSFVHNAPSCTSSYRTSDQGNTRYRRVGFRVVSRIDP